MIGPTGCGKTEIARRIAKLCEAPFIKVEATKFTEVGYHGRDVDQIVKDLVNISINLTKENLRKKARSYVNRVQEIAEDYLLDHILGPNFINRERREQKRQQIRDGEMDERIIYIEIPEIEKIISKYASHLSNPTFEEYLEAIRRYSIFPHRTG